MVTLNLDWQGPFCLGTPEGRQAFDPPREGGVYLWCVGRHPVYRVSYVGQTGRPLRERMYEHIFSMLGGAYRLYSDDHLVNAVSPVKSYEGGFENILETFLADFDKYSRMALHNLQSYSFFWAAISGELPGSENRWSPLAVRQAAESALITEAKDRCEPLQNSISLSSANSPRLTIISSFQPGIDLPGVPKEIYYGALD